MRRDSGLPAGGAIHQRGIPGSLLNRAPGREFIADFGVVSQVDGQIATYVGDYEDGIEIESLDKEYSEKDFQNQLKIFTTYFNKVVLKFYPELQQLADDFITRYKEEYLST